MGPQLTSYLELGDLTVANWVAVLGQRIFVTVKSNFTKTKLKIQYSYLDSNAAYENECNHWVDTSAGGLSVPEGIISSVVSASVLTRFNKLY